jgi:hypothetical protein
MYLAIGRAPPGRHVQRTSTYRVQSLVSSIDTPGAAAATVSETTATKLASRTRLMQAGSRDLMGQLVRGRQVRAFPAHPIHRPRADFGRIQLRVPTTRGIISRTLDRPTMQPIGALQLAWSSWRTVSAIFQAGRHRDREARLALTLGRGACASPEGSIALQMNSCQCGHM